MSPWSAALPLPKYHQVYLVLRPDRYQYEMQLSRVGSVDAKVWVGDELTARFH